jgi:murein DD-endopeptidase MepM/ murein hydrolase activator NlpD
MIGIASYYCLRPETIFWANYDLLRINENHLIVGMVIDIPAKDGEYAWAPSSYGQDDPGSGACQEPASDFNRTGTFIWPTKEHHISGADYAPKLYQFGIDLAGSSGDPVYASDGGVVVFAGWSDWGYGNLVVLDHSGGRQTLYAYLSSVAVTCGEQRSSRAARLGRSVAPATPAGQRCTLRSL